MLLRIVFSFLFFFCNRYTYISFGVLFVFTVLFFSANPFAKTLSGIKKNISSKIYRIKAANPFDVSSVQDGNGGIYFFWREGRSTIESKVYYAYLILAQNFPQEILVKNISQLSFIQIYPKSIPYFSNDAVVAWKDYSNQSTADLYLQRLSENEPIWTKTGVRANILPEQIIDYSLCSDNAGNIFIVYLSREEYPSKDYTLKYQRILADGSLTFRNEAVWVENSPRVKNNIKIIHDNNGGAFILWTEKFNEKELLLIKKLDPSGKSVLGKRPIKISATMHDVTGFSIGIINKTMLYIVWETRDKNIYHQLINSLGKAVWTVGGTKAAFTKGENLTPQVIQEDSLITLAWINTFNKKNSICVQKFKINGKEIWKNRGVKGLTVSNYINQYTIAKDNNGGVYIASLSNSKDNFSCNLNILRINAMGKSILDSTNYSTSSQIICSKNTTSIFTVDKDIAAISYQNSAGEIIVEPIKNSIEEEKDFVILKSESNGSEINLLVNTNISNENSPILVERRFQSDTAESVWQPIGKAERISAVLTEYQFIDKPIEFGTIYYRAVLGRNNKEVVSNETRVDYLEAATKIVVAQNNPNPFKDSTVISFYLPHSAIVAFEFFNEHAEKIREYAEQEFYSGENSVTFYSSGLQPGIYFYKLYTKDFVEVKKMVIN